MNVNNTTTNQGIYEDEPRILQLPNLESSTIKEIIGEINSVEQEFWKLRPKAEPMSEFRRYIHTKNDLVTLTYLFPSYSNMSLFLKLASERAKEITSKNINYECCTEFKSPQDNISRFDHVATCRMSQKEKENYFATKVF